MAYHPSAFCDRRGRAAAYFVSIGLAVSLMIVPWCASSASGVSPSPTTSVLIPSNGATLSGTRVILDASASNAMSVEFRLFGGVYGYNAPVLCTATPTLYGWLCAWNTTTVPNGSYELLSEAINAFGSAFSSGVGVTVKNPLPTTSILVPSNGASRSGSTYLDASATNATSVEFRLLGGSFGFNAPVLCTATPTIYGWLCKWYTTVPSGSYILVSEAFNSAGSAFSSGISITITRPVTAYVANEGDGTITPIDTATNTAETPITGLTNPFDIAITPNGATAYVTNFLGNTVTPINLATNTAGIPITVGTDSVWDIAITPDGTTAYVTTPEANTVTPINLATNIAGTPITVGNDPGGIAITPNGTTAYVGGDDTVTPIDLATNTAENPITVEGGAFAIAITPNGATAYADSLGDGNGDTVTPIDTATNTAGTTFAVNSSSGFTNIAITPNGTTAYVTQAITNEIGNTVTPIDLATNTVEPAIAVAGQPFGIAITPNGTTAFVSTTGDDTVTPINTTTNTVETPIGVGASPFGVAIG
jgi:YVTN family beta-propeller protein